MPHKDDKHMIPGESLNRKDLLILLGIYFNNFRGLLFFHFNGRLVGLTYKVNTHIYTRWLFCGYNQIKLNKTKEIPLGYGFLTP